MQSCMLSLMCRSGSFLAAVIFNVHLGEYDESDHICILILDAAVYMPNVGMSVAVVYM